MLELGIGADIARGIGWMLWAAIFGATLVALRVGKNWKQRIFFVGLVLAVLIAPFLPNAYRNWEYQQRYKAAKAIFDERCKTAGERIYRTVEDVEGVLLLYVPPKASDANLHDPNWPDAGLPQQYGGENYIANFLRWEHFQGQPRGALNNAPSNTEDHPGYRYVDIKGAEGTFFRYTLRNSKEGGQELLKKEKMDGEISRYSVSLTHLITLEDRKNWVAGVTVVVTDTQTGEALAKGTWYSFEPGLGSRAGHRTPWLFAKSCPELRGGQERAPVRFFVDQILKPKKGV